jgi:hypothetical protein
MAEKTEQPRAGKQNGDGSAKVKRDGTGQTQQATSTRENVNGEPGRAATAESVPSLGALTLSLWEHNIKLAMSLVPACLDVYERAVATFSPAYHQVSRAGERVAAASQNAGEQVTQSVRDVVDAETDTAAGAANATRHSLSG